MTTRLKPAILTLFILSCCLAITCNADTVSGNGQWEAWHPGQATPDIDWCTAGSAGCVVTTPTGTVNYYESANGNLAAPSSVSFTGSAQFVNLSFSFNAAALGPGVDNVGFYVETQAGTIASMIPLFSTVSQNSNVLLAVSSGAQYGFYVENVQGQTDSYYFMNSNLNYSNNGSLAADQHFALYDAPAMGTYFVGIENQLSVFNSMLLTATYQPAPSDPTTPEPASTALAGLGLATFGFFFARKRASAKQHRSVA